VAPGRLAAALGLVALLAGCGSPGGTGGTDTGTGDGTGSATATGTGTGGGSLPAQAWFHFAGGEPAQPSDYNGTPPAFELRTAPGVWGWEPMLGLDAGGALFVGTEGNTTIPDDGLQGQAVRVLRSLDLGRSWTLLAPGLAGQDVPNPASLDPFLHLDEATGRVYAGQARAECTTLSWSDDRGATWTTHPAACGNPLEDHPTLFSGPAGALPTLDPAFPRILHLCSSQVFEGTCKRSLDGGLTFLAPTVPFAGRQECRQGPTGHGVVSEATGTAFLGQVGCGAVWVAASRDGGVTWSLASFGASRGCGHDVSLALDAAGTLYAAYPGEGCLPALAWSQDDGRTWSEPVAAARPGLAEGSHISLAAGAPGRIAILYMGTEDPAEAGAARRWSHYATLSLDAASARPAFATVDAGGRPLVSGTDPGGALTNSVRGIGDFLDAAVDPLTGWVVGAAVDVCQGPCTDAPPPPGPFGRAGAVVQVGGTPLGAAAG
jgi:hypothetical protein